MTAQALRFTLACHEVPCFPNSVLYVDQLRWAVAVADHDDSDLAFIASLLSYAIREHGLTPRQRPHADKIIQRLYSMWAEGRLRAQQTQLDQTPKASNDLARLNVIGEA